MVPSLGPSAAMVILGMALPEVHQQHAGCDPVTTHVQSVTVELLAGVEVVYPWATEARISRKGDLQIMKGWRQRAYHPRDEWLTYTVENRHVFRPSSKPRTEGSPPQ
jgi:hypothetical protein